MMTDGADFCFGVSPPSQEKPNRLGSKAFYLLLAHRSGTIGNVTDLKEAMRLARKYAASDPRCAYVVMKAVAVLRPRFEELLLTPNPEDTE